MHIRGITLHPDQYPTTDHYPFDQPVFRETRSLDFTAPVTFFTGENGTGKSTLLEAVAQRCGIRGIDAEDLSTEAYALFAARAGYVVLAPAWWGWPGRDGHLDRVGDRDRCNVIQMAASMYGINVLRWDLAAPFLEKHLAKYDE